METERPGIDFPELAHESQRIWSQNARWWDGRMQEGNDWHNRLIAPTVMRLLSLRAGEDVVDLGCGNGLLARAMAQQGARVVACDSSGDFLECARARGPQSGNPIDYRLIDLTDAGQLDTLGSAQFDAAVCNMAIMDLACITPLLCQTVRLLRPAGRFVFSILHPCFNAFGTRLIAERGETGGAIEYAVQVHRYLSAGSTLGTGIAGQPESHYYFHRPLSALLAACFAVGFVLDSFEEPNPRAAVPSGSLLSWDYFSEIPPILVVRFRLNFASPLGSPALV
jgi:2-polyprenyl-3-methyl-5-hydroxy-6-metoxy-1,4-benzoquinol methylase